MTESGSHDFALDPMVLSRVCDSLGQTGVGSGQNLGDMSLRREFSALVSQLRVQLEEERRQGHVASFFSRMNRYNADTSRKQKTQKTERTRFPSMGSRLMNLTCSSQANLRTGYLISYERHP